MKKTCEECKWYHFWDSAYGRCLRFPPAEHRVVEGFLFKRISYKCRYPFITFDGNTCGEFAEKEVNKQ